MACAIMAFAGGLFGVVLGNSFINEFYTAYPVDNRYWQVRICPPLHLFKRIVSLCAHVHLHPAAGRRK